MHVKATRLLKLHENEVSKTVIESLPKVGIIHGNGFNKRKSAREGKYRHEKSPTYEVVLHPSEVTKSSQQFCELQNIFLRDSDQMRLDFRLCLNLARYVHFISALLNRQRKLLASMYPDQFKTVS